MSLFCLVWMPLFYLFRRSVSGDNAAGGVWALLAGIVAAPVQFFPGPLVKAGGFGLSRWVSGCVDIVVLPALAPLLVYLALVGFKLIRGTVDFTNFALLWLIPVAAVRAFASASRGDPVFLVLVPLLWTAVAAGVPVFIGLLLNSRKLVAIPAAFGILAVPAAAASSYWAFFAHKTSLGFLLLFAAAAPLLVSTIHVFFRESGRA